MSRGRAAAASSIANGARQSPQHVVSIHTLMVQAIIP